MSERLKEPVSKTVRGQTHGGSNPSPSARKSIMKKEDKFEMTTDKCWVGQEHLLADGVEIEWLAANSEMVSATIVDKCGYGQYNVRNKEDGRVMAIWIEQIKKLFLESVYYPAGEEAA